LGVDHGMAHTLSAFYDTPHGVACALLLPYVMEYNADFTGDKFKFVAQAMGVNTTGLTPEEYKKAAVDAVRKLSLDIGIPQKLHEIGVKQEDIPELAQSAIKDACTPGNPRDVTVEEIEALFRKAF
jgi:lactaldehyde reductase